MLANTHKLYVNSKEVVLKNKHDDLDDVASLIFNPKTREIANR